MLKLQVYNLENLSCKETTLGHTHKKHQPLLHNVNLAPKPILQEVLLEEGEHQVLEVPVEEINYS